MSQTVFSGIGSSVKIADALIECSSKKIMLVCDSSYQYLSNKDIIENIQIPIVKFMEFTPNPLYEQIVMGVDIFNANKCDAIVAVGGGSTIDVAKCIKLFCKLDKNKNYLEQEYSDNGIPIIAVPSTAGTGSESTRHAVCYFEGKKQSINHLSIIPDYAVLDAGLLISLPLYQKKCTMLDALCQGIESWWSVNSTDESIEYSKQAVKLVIDNWREYIEKNSQIAAEKIMYAANLAGRAINITATTAAHAMSYKLTSMCNLPHGHAVAVCMTPVWEYMTGRLNECIDPRGSAYLSGVFEDISHTMGYKTSEEAIDGFLTMLQILEMKNPVIHNKNDLDILTASVNPLRLKNNPIVLEESVLRKLYEQVIGDNN